ncbi:MAG: hypothetical protein E7462_00950 [Ruminococcaceae bacterium]|nr:hypothetical protein [Oscillospiraceae bacterium]
MKFSQSLWQRTVMLVIITVITLGIFINSCENTTVSYQSSGMIAQVIPSGDGADMVSREILVRKAAHLIEFAVLGIAVIGLVLFERSRFQRSVYGLALFYVLAVAVADEYIQSFSDRTSSTGDIVLDFLGALIGFGCVLLVHFIVRQMKKRKQSCRQNACEAN